MQNSSGRVFLKVCGILMIIGGIFSIIVSGILGLIGYFGGNEIAQAGNYASGEVIGTIIIVGAIISLIGGIIELIAGIVGVKNSDKPEKATTCIVWGFIVLVINVISIIMSISGGSSNVGSIIGSVIFSLALPVLYLVGAFKNKKSAS